MSHAALFRNDRGGLEVRSFATAADAARVAAEREIAGPRGRVRGGSRGISSSELARQIGVHPRTIRRRWAKGELPGIEHGEHTLIIPHEAVRLVKTYGLLGYARKLAAGQI